MNRRERKIQTRVRRMQSEQGDVRRMLVPVAVGLAAVMFVFPLTIPFALLDPDEGLHASIAQEMVERGNWTIPRFLGQPFLDKPVFFFWMQAASLRLLGPNEMAVRLPGLLFGLLGAITTGLLGGRIFGGTTGLVAGILYATTILPTAMAQAASHDVALIPWVTLAILLVWEAEHAAGRPAALGCICGTGVFLGLAVLTKGLLGAGVVAVAYGSYLLVTHWKKLRRGEPPPAERSLGPHAPRLIAVLLGGVVMLAIAALIAAPWYVLAERETPGYLRYFFLERHVLGFATLSQPHGDEPWWYYFPVLLGGGLPWIAYLPAVARDSWARRQDSDAMRLLWSWLIGWTLLMLVAGSKLATYVWPVFPALAVLTATAWMRLIQGTLDAAARRSFARTFVSGSWSGPLVLPCAVLAMQLAFGVRFSWPVWIAVAAAAALAPVPLIPWRAGRWHAALAAAALSVAGQFSAIMTMVLPPVAENFSARELARHFNQLGQLPPRLLVIEGRLGSLVFYLTPELRRQATPERLQQWAAKERPAIQLGDVVAVPERKIANFRRYHLCDGEPFETVGHYRLYKITQPRPMSRTADPLFQFNIMVDGARPHRAVEPRRRRSLESRRQGEPCRARAAGRTSAAVLRWRRLVAPLGRAALGGIMADDPDLQGARCQPLDLVGAVGSDDCRPRRSVARDKDHRTVRDGAALVGHPAADRRAVAAAAGADQETEHEQPFHPSSFAGAAISHFLLS
jgi:4-amino-4-deoxy-L-arabinose transferase-like glycosyltransferase